MERDLELLNRIDELEAVVDRTEEHLELLANVSLLGFKKLAYNIGVLEGEKRWMWITIYALSAAVGGCIGYITYLNDKVKEQEDDGC